MRMYKGIYNHIQLVIVAGIASRRSCCVSRRCRAPAMAGCNLRPNGCASFNGLTVTPRDGNDVSFMSLEFETSVYICVQHYSTVCANVPEHPSTLGSKPLVQKPSQRDCACETFLSIGPGLRVDSGKKNARPRNASSVTWNDYKGLSFSEIIHLGFIYDCLILSSAIGLFPEEIFKRHAWLMKPTAKRAVHAAPRKRRRASTARKRIFSLKIQRVKRVVFPLCSNEARVESHTVVVKVLTHLDTENTLISDHKLSTWLQATWAPNVRSTGHVWPVPSQLWQFSAHWETSRTSQKLMEEGSLGGKFDAKMKAG